MALFIFCLFLLLSLVLPGMEMRRVGFDLLSLPLGCLVLSNTSMVLSWMPGVIVFFAQLSEREGSRGVQFADFKGSLQQLVSSHLRERDKMLLRAILCGGVLELIPSIRPRRMMFPVSFVKKLRRSFVLGVYLSTFIACEGAA